MGKSMMLRGIILCAMLAAAAPAGAQMYKWVDERGQVSYSNTPPPDSAQKKVESVAERLSVYTPDDELNRAMSAEGRREAKAATLGRQFEAERNARRAPLTNAELAARDASAYERCVADRRVDCEYLRSGGEPTYGYLGSYGPQFVLGARNFPPGVPFRVDPTPAPRVGVSTAPPVGISTAPPVGAPPRSRSVGFFR
jgi:hypothetical protein